MKLLRMMIALSILTLALALPLLAVDCDAELNQCLADCASFGSPTMNGQTCTSVCVFYYRQCESTGGRYCPGWGGGSGCYEQN